MKKITFWILVFITIRLAVSVGNILLVDYSRLTEYGFGYLTGLIILLFLVTALTIFIGFRIFKRKIFS
jgi:hypothetical protein